MSRLCRVFLPQAFLGILAFAIFGCATTQSASENKDIAVGNQFAKDGLYREAATSYRRALAKSPKHATAHRNLGMVLVKLGEYKAASRHIETSMARYSNDFDANYHLGEAYRGQDKYAEALFRYQKALKIKPDNPKALKPLAWSFFKIRYYSEALIAARKLTKLDPRDDQGWIILSRTLLKLKRSREALSILRSAKRRIAKTSRPYYNSVEGDILYEIGRCDKATKAYRAALKAEPLLAGALLGMGRCLMKKNKKKAIIYMERAVRIRPRLTEAYYMLGKAYEKRDRQKSLRYFKIFRKQAAADPEFLGQLREVNRRIGRLQK